jgi:hypothetical protein
MIYTELLNSGKIMFSIRHRKLLNASGLWYDILVDVEEIVWIVLRLDLRQARVVVAIS